ncbi:MAG: NAD(+) synthase [Pyramidobacter sp.]|nr:NAD(+) synthase [Pyramidobacter sp.]
MIPLRDAKKLIDFVEGWIRQTVSSSGARGAVVGLSGGIDSAVAAALMKNALGRENVFAVKMPCHSMTADGEDADLVARALDIQTLEVDLSETFDAFSRALNAAFPPSPIAAANIKPRLRMTTVYSIAQTLGCLVCGTGNKDELTVGYFTKFGDGGCDFMPLADLTKSEVFAMAKELGIPSAVISKPPSAGLWEGQTDEKEMGLTYAAIDAYLTGQPVDAESLEKIKRREAASQHKKKMPPMCIIGEL